MVLTTTFKKIEHNAKRSYWIRFRVRSFLERVIPAHRPTFVTRRIRECDCDRRHLANRCAREMPRTGSMNPCITVIHCISERPVNTFIHGRRGKCTSGPNATANRTPLLLRSSLPLSSRIALIFPSWDLWPRGAIAIAVYYICLSIVRTELRLNRSGE